MLKEMMRPVQAGLRQERKLETIANNYANLTTPGFKKDVLAFDQELRAQMATDFSGGKLRATGNKLDVALVGEGFFKIQTNQGPRYTRSGNFTLDNTGQLVTPNGDPVLGTGGPLVINGSQVHINEAGQVQVDGNPVGTLSIVDFSDRQALEKSGDTLFINRGGPQNEIPAEATAKQEALEMSNAALTSELIQVERTYETYQKMMQTFDDINAKIISEVSRPI